MATTRPIPQEIKRLRLCSALSNCGATPVQDAFEESFAPDLSVFDSETTHATEWVPRDTGAPKDFHISNPGGRNVVLLPLDNKIITGNTIAQGGVADCALLASDLLAMVEFKTNVTSNTDYNLDEKTQDAIGQLWHTYDAIIRPRCAAVGVDIERAVSVEFYIKFDESLDVTRVTARRMSAQVEFKNDHRGLPLYFDHGRAI